MRVEGRPDADAEIVSRHGHLVDQRNVHVSERVLQKLGQLHFGGTRDRVQSAPRACCGFVDPFFSNTAGVRPGDDFWGLFSRVQFVLPGSMLSGL